ncbi:anti-sigma factor [uncultured Alsobacter sp.]|uniref:anti-sigma factor n=1 Tax=uncultured Alsobacter sp. TaxID=1748258 RepID=UPI0025DFFACD|nr:anti-sigma factor [uncultured Alsobacter sp.]
MSAGDDDRLAAEHVMGLLDGAERDRAEQMLDNDPAYGRLYRDWQDRFAELDLSAPAITPSAALWPSIEASVASLPAAVVHSRAVPRPVRQARPSLWSSLGFWRPAALAAGLAAVMLATGLVAALNRAARTPVLVAVLVTDTSKPAAIVNAFADGRTELVPLESIAVPPGKALEIWTLWDRARGPVSVGLIGQARSVPLRLDGLPRPGPDQLFEITLEDAKGSPTGRPTGPVLMKGTASTAL